MAYQFTQTGAEIQGILNQVGTNTSDIASLNTAVANLSPLFLMETVQTTYSATSGTATNFSFTVPAHSGYYFVGVVSWNIANNRAYVYEITRVSDTSVRISIQPSATVSNLTATIVCLYIKIV